MCEGGADVKQQRQQVPCVRNTDIPSKISVNYFYEYKNETDLYPDVDTKIGIHITYELSVSRALLCFLNN
jgi:hypothetical protein